MYMRTLTTAILVKFLCLFWKCLYMYVCVHSPRPCESYLCSLCKYTQGIRGNTCKHTYTHTFKITRVFQEHTYMYTYVFVVSEKYAKTHAYIHIHIHIDLLRHVYVCRGLPRYTQKNSFILSRRWRNEC